jgi:hypothetical protein
VQQSVLRACPSIHIHARPVRFELRTHARLASFPFSCVCVCGFPFSCAHARGSDLPSNTAHVTDGAHCLSNSLYAQAQQVLQTQRLATQLHHSTTRWCLRNLTVQRMHKMHEEMQSLVVRECFPHPLLLRLPLPAEGYGYGDWVWRA